MNIIFCPVVEIFPKNKFLKVKPLQDIKSYYFERYHKIAYKNILPIPITSKYACFLHILTSLYYLLNFCHLTIILIYTLSIGGIEHIFTYWTLSFFWELSIYIFCGSNYLISCKAHQAHQTIKCT